MTMLFLPGNSPQKYSNLKKLRQAGAAQPIRMKLKPVQS